MLSILSIGFILQSLVFSNPSQAVAVAKPFHQKIFFVNVGQGDFTLLDLKDSCWFFDAGGESSQISQSLRNLLANHCTQKSINVVLSHFDRDHYTKLKGLSRIGHVDNFFYSNPKPHSQYGKKLLSGLKLIFPQATLVVGFKKLVLENIEILMTAPSLDLKKKIENDWSLVVKIKTPKKTILITGDAPIPTQQLATQTDSSNIFGIDVLRLAHHGSAHNTSSKLLKTLKPKMCVISVGAQNSYGHPHPQILKDLTNNHCAILRTDRIGTIEMGL